MTVKIRLLYRDAGDHIAFRDASEHVVDPRDRGDTRAALHGLDMRLAQAHDAIAVTLHQKIRQGEATLADLEKAVADKAAATGRYAADRQAIIDTAFEQARQEPWTPMIVTEPDEVEFDHVPSEAELDAAFPNRRKLIG